VVTTQRFTPAEVWHGGSYDLGIELGPHDDVRLGQALAVVWSILDGCYEHRNREPHEQPRVEVGTLSFETTLHGFARIAALPPIACCTHVLRFDDGTDWIYVSLPIGGLARVLNIGAFPFADGVDPSWRYVLDEWLCVLAQAVFEAVPFGLALVGWDGGEPDDADAFRALGVPAKRTVGYLVGEVDGLRWFPANQLT
jgi:hypothetical protein